MIDPEIVNVDSMGLKVVEYRVKWDIATDDKYNSIINNMIRNIWSMDISSSERVFW